MHPPYRFDGISTARHLLCTCSASLVWADSLGPLSETCRIRSTWLIMVRGVATDFASRNAVGACRVRVLLRPGETSQLGSTRQAPRDLIDLFGSHCSGPSPLGLMDPTTEFSMRCQKPRSGTPGSKARVPQHLTALYIEITSKNTPGPSNRRL